MSEQSNDTESKYRIKQRYSELKGLTSRYFYYVNVCFGIGGGFTLGHVVGRMLLFTGHYNSTLITANIYELPNYMCNSFMKDYVSEYESLCNNLLAPFDQYLNTVTGHVGNILQAFNVNPLTADFSFISDAILADIPYVEKLITATALGCFFYCVSRFITYSNKIKDIETKNPWLLHK